LEPHTNLQKTILIRAGIGATIFAACVAAIPHAVALDQNPKNVRSRISIFELATKKTTVLYSANRLWEAPN
jgi:hypothetical protein